MGAGQLRACPQHQGRRQPQVVVGEAASLVAKEDEAAEVVADPQRNGQQVLDLEVVRHVVHELGEARLVDAHELFARGKSAQERTRPDPVDGLRAQSTKSEARRLGYELLAVGRYEVGAGESRPHLAGDARREGSDVTGFRAFRV